MSCLEPEFSAVLELEFDTSFGNTPYYKYFVKKVTNLFITAYCPFCDFNSVFIEKNHYRKQKLRQNLYEYCVSAICVNHRCKCKTVPVFTIQANFESPFITSDEDIQRKKVYGNVVSVAYDGKNQDLKPAPKPDVDKTYPVSPYIPEDYTKLFYDALKTLETKPEFSFVLTKQILKKFIKNRIGLDYDLEENILILKFIQLYSVEPSPNFKLIHDLTRFRWEETENITDLEDAVLYNLKVLFDMFNIIFVHPERRKYFSEFIESKIKNPPKD